MEDTEKTKKTLYTLTLTEVEKFDLDECTEWLNLLAEKTKKWVRLEQALTTRREKVMSEHTTDEEGGWFQEKNGRHFCRIWKRDTSYGNRPVYVLVEISRFKESVSKYYNRHSNSNEKLVFRPLDGGDTILVNASDVGDETPYQIQKGEATIEKRHVKDCDTFYDNWEKTTPFLLVVKHGADHIELARDHFNKLTEEIESGNTGFNVVRYKNTWYIIGTINY